MKQLLMTSALTLALTLATAVSAQPRQSIKPPFPQIELPAKARGERALQQLGARLPEVAAWYGKTPAEFASIFRRDHTVWLDRNGRVFYEEELEQPLPVDAPAESQSLTATGNLAPLDQTFNLHSKQGSKRTIYLNFKGATLSGTAWNTSTQPTITALPFDLDGVPYSFSTTELQRIQYIWQRVAEDFAAFDVNVTTEAPSPDRLSRSTTSDDTYGTTVLITKRTFYSCSCGGVAYLGVFDDTRDTYKPALVFYDALSGSEKYVAEAISHEAGHNVGLHHDGTSTTAYYTGHGSGTTAWAPIMGVGYSKPLVQWSKGEYPNANNREDDYVVMASNGLVARADDHGNTIGAATRLTGVTASGVTTFEGSGFIERASDVDAFSFVSGAGAISMTIRPAQRSPNLDLIAQLVDSTGATLVSANPVDAFGATLTHNATNGGTFFVTVKGTGKGDLTTGYSNYGSLGEYSIAATAPAATSQSPVAVLSAAPTSGMAPLGVSFASTGSYDPDGSVQRIEWNFGDGSAPQVAASAQHVYAAPGTYTATLKVTDNAGLTDTRSVTVRADAPVTVLAMHIEDIALSLRVHKNGQAEAVASVTVRDANGNAVPGATVSGTWSGVVNSSTSAMTGSSGVATMKTQRTRAQGSFTFTVTAISLAGYQYVPASNKESTATVSR